MTTFDAVQKNIEKIENIEQNNQGELNEKQELALLQASNQETFNEILGGYQNLIDSINARLKNPETAPTEKKESIAQKKVFQEKIKELQNKHPEFASAGKKEKENTETHEKTPSELNIEIERTARKQRIESEDEQLKNSPGDRKMKLLDYIRRGREFDDIEILPDIIALTPEIFQSGLIDFSGQNYNEEEAKKNLIDQYKQIEEAMKEEDAIIKEFLMRYDLAPKNKNTLVNDKWFMKIQVAFNKFKIPKNEKSTLTVAEHEARARKTLTSALSALVDGNIDGLLHSYKENPNNLSNLSFPDKNFSPIAKLVFDKITDKGVIRLPTMAEYTGATIEEPPRFIDKEPKPDLTMVERDKIPSFKGGIMLDGNFGYDDHGAPIRPDDKIIIDHHDKFDTKTHDTATVMAFRFIENPKELAKLDDPKYLDENGKLKILTNHIDSDSIFSTWILHNRQKLLEKKAQNPNEYKALKNSFFEIAKAGDFLVGGKALEAGGTPRDYEYIIRGYINACRKQIKEGRLEKLEAENQLQSKELGELLQQAEKIKGEIAKKKEEPELKETEKEIQTAQKNKDWAMVKNLKNKITALLGDVEIQKSKLDQKIKDKEQAIKNIEKNKSKADSNQLSPKENAMLLSHMHDVIEDIAANPFQYKKYLLEERGKENKAIGQVDASYRQGDIEITKDPADKDILFVKPLALASNPKVENIDGEYFFYRRREDFNRELIVKIEKNSFMMAINTQNMKGLEKYDFNKLIDKMREKETEAIRDQISEKERELASSQGDKKNSERIKNELKTLESDNAKNIRGQLWRNRTQMIFAFKTYIPEQELMDIVHAWKNENNQ